jgi:ABC-type polysaccharide/polyol phosphate export permease
MIARSRILAFGYRAVAALVIVIGIARVSGLWTASPNWSAFLYYTVLSNVLCLGWMVLSALATLRDAWSGSTRRPGRRR